MPEHSYHKIRQSTRKPGLRRKLRVFRSSSLRFTLRVSADVSRKSRNRVFDERPPRLKSRHQKLHVSLFLRRSVSSASDLASRVQRLKKGSRANDWQRTPTRPAHVPSIPGRNDVFFLDHAPEHPAINYTSSFGAKVSDGPVRNPSALRPSPSDAASSTNDSLLTRFLPRSPPASIDVTQ